MTTHNVTFALEPYPLDEIASIVYKTPEERLALEAKAFAKAWEQYRYDRHYFAGVRQSFERMRMAERLTSNG